MRLLTVLLLAAAACRPEPEEPPAKPKPPATVEADLGAVILDAKAKERLGIRPEELVRKKLPRTRTFGADVVLPPGASITVAAPLAGTLAGGPVRAGASVKKGDALFTLAPLIPPEARAQLEVAAREAEGAAGKAAAELDAAKTALARAEQLVKEGAGSLKSLDEARARTAAAQAAARAAQGSQEALKGALGGVGSLPLTAPTDGVVRAVHAVPGQTVPAGAPLFEVVDLARVWVRVPVYVGDRGSVANGREALVGELAGRASAPRSAKPVEAPPSADPDAATVDFFFEMENADRAFRPGQRVGATLVLREEEESLVVPWAAVYTDLHGGTWVYEAVEELRFVRRRVQVRRVAGDLAVLESGPKPGAKIVTGGAAELAGAELGLGK